MRRVKNPMSLGVGVCQLEYLSKAHLKRVLLARLNRYRSELVRLQAPKMDKTTPMCREAIHEKTALIHELKYLMNKLGI